MKILSDLPRLFLFVVIGALILLLLNKWVSFSTNFESALAEQQKNIIVPTIDYPDIDGTENTSIDPLEFNRAVSTNIDQNHNSLVPDESLSVNQLTTSQSYQTTASTTDANRTVTIETDTLRVTLDKRGGDIIEVALLKHRESNEVNAKPFLLLEKNPLRTYIAQSGLIGQNGTDSKSGRAVFHSAQSFYKMENGDDLIVDLTFRDVTGVLITKRYTLVSNEHLITITYLIDNLSDEEWRATFYSQINRDSSEDPGANNVGLGVRAYLGAATTTTDKPYKKISFKDIAKKDFRHQQQGGWVAMLQHYFVTAWIPDANSEHNFFTKLSKGGLSIIGFTSAPLIIPAGESDSIEAKFYVGPKDQYRLQEIAPNLDLTVDYGWLWWIAQPLFALLYFFVTVALSYR